MRVVQLWLVYLVKFRDCIIILRTRIIVGRVLLYISESGSCEVSRETHGDKVFQREISFEALVELAQRLSVTDISNQKYYVLTTSYWSWKYFVIDLRPLKLFRRPQKKKWISWSFDLVVMKFRVSCTSFGSSAAPIAWLFYDQYRVSSPAVRLTSLRSSLKESSVWRGL